MNGAEKVAQTEVATTAPEGGPTLGAALEEAKRLICGDRRADYGGVEESFTDVAQAWSILFDTIVTPEQVALAMVLLKVFREKRNHKHDNLVDIAGYAGLADFMAELKLFKSSTRT